MDLTPIAPFLTALTELQTELASLLIERDEAIHAALVALIAREHLLLIGPPGTAKSRLVNLLARQITAHQGGSLSLFSWLMTKFTTPEDLYGPVSLEGLKNDRYARVTTARLPEAHLVFLDEVLRGSDPILETLLTAMNEREFDNDGKRHTIPLLSVFGATNEVNVPSNTDGKIGAVWDRFLLRLTVGYVSDARFSQLLAYDSANPISGRITLSDLEIVQQYAMAIQVPPAIIELLRQLRQSLLEKQIVVSDRRWTQCVSLLRAEALFAGRAVVEQTDLKILKHALWQKLDQTVEVTRAIIHLVAPFESEVLEHQDNATSVMEALSKTQADATLSDEQRMKAAMEAIGKLRGCVRALEGVRTQMLSSHFQTGQADAALTQVKAMITTVSELITSPTL